MNITQNIIDSELKKAREDFVADLLKNHYWTNTMVTDNAEDIDNKVRSKVLSELATKMKVDYKIDFFTAYSILDFVTNDISSDEIFTLIQPYKDDKTYLELFYKFSHYDIPANIVAKEISLINNKEDFLDKWILRYYANKAFIEHPECKELSISNIANSFHKHPELTDNQIFYIAYYRFADIAYGSMTLEETLNNSSKYYPNGSGDAWIGLKPFCLAESLDSFFHVKQSKEILKEIPDYINLEKILIDINWDSNSSATDL